MSEVAQAAYENYYIKPDDIDISKYLRGAFNKLGVEVLASAIVLFCQTNGYWRSFDIEALKLYCEDTGANTAFLKILRELEYIVVDKWNKYCVTIKFVKRCYDTNPKNK